MSITQCFKRSGKILLRSTIIALCVIGIARFCHHQTRGFRLTKIQNNLCPDQNLSLSKISPSEILPILNQNFRYYNRGFQSFVFLSEDGNYILKVFNNRHQNKMAFFSFIAQFPLTSGWAQSRLSYHRQKLLRAFYSYKIAFEELKEETALLYVHLEKTDDLPSSFTLIDPLQIAHTIDLNKTGFVVQKRVKMAYSTLADLISQGDLKTAQERISSLLDFLICRCRKGIGDNDPLIRTNFGFLDGRAVEIDIGPFFKDPTIHHPKVYTPEVIRITSSLKNWLNETAPALSAFLDQELQEKLSS